MTEIITVQYLIKNSSCKWCQEHNKSNVYLYIFVTQFFSFCNYNRSWPFTSDNILLSKELAISRS